jgi:hypothetical protein
MLNGSILTRVVSALALVASLANLLVALLAIGREHAKAPVPVQSPAVASRPAEFPPVVEDTKGAGLAEAWQLRPREFSAQRNWSAPQPTPEAISPRLTIEDTRQENLAHSPEQVQIPGESISEGRQEFVAHAGAPDVSPDEATGSTTSAAAVKSVDEATQAVSIRFYAADRRPVTIERKKDLDRILDGESQPGSIQLGPVDPAHGVRSPDSAFPAAAMAFTDDRPAGRSLLTAKAIERRSSQARPRDLDDEKPQPGRKPAREAERQERPTKLVPRSDKHRSEPKPAGDVQPRKPDAGAVRPAVEARSRSERRRVQVIAEERQPPPQPAARAAQHRNAEMDREAAPTLPSKLLPTLPPA